MPKLSERGQDTRKAILDSAFDLFHERGCHATSVDDILKASGKGKSQFYHYFQSKEDLIHQLLVGIYEHIRADQPPFDHKIESWRDLETWFHKQIKMQESYGFSRSCPIGVMGNGTTQEDALLRRDIEMIFEAIKEKPKTFFTIQKAQGNMTEEADPEALADYCVCVMQGGFLLSKVRQSGEAVENTADHLLTYLKSFFKKTD